MALKYLTNEQLSAYAEAFNPVVDAMQYRYGNAEAIAASLLAFSIVLATGLKSVEAGTINMAEVYDYAKRGLPGAAAHVAALGTGGHPAAQDIADGILAASRNALIAIEAAAKAAARV